MGRNLVYDIDRLSTSFFGAKTKFEEEMRLIQTGFDALSRKERKKDAMWVEVLRWLKELLLAATEIVILLPGGPIVGARLAFGAAIVERVEKRAQKSAEQDRHDSLVEKVAKKARSHKICPNEDLEEW